MRRRRPDQGAHALMLALWMTFVLGCPGDEDFYFERRADIPANTASAVVKLTAVVPEGVWKLGISASGGSELRSREPSADIKELTPTCGSSCSARRYLLRCPGGKCRFTFELAVAGMTYTPTVSAGVFFSEEAEEGCGGPDPNYVPSEDIGRLFQLSFEVSDVVVGEWDAGVRPGGADAGLQPDGSAPVDAAVARADGAAKDASFDAAAGPIITARGGVVDERDGQRYATVTLGRQTWFAQNLNYGSYQPGLYSGSLLADDERVEKYCPHDDAEQCRTFGGLYTWAEALALPASCLRVSCAERIASLHRGICPAGWHVPSYAEWSELALYLARHQGVNTGDAHGAWMEIGTMLKSMSGWDTAGSDESGFGVLPTSEVGVGGALPEGTKQAAFHTTDEPWDDNASGPLVFEPYAAYGVFAKVSPASVRCVQDP